MPAPRRIFVTGAHGFVGSHLIRRLRVAFPDAEIAAPRASALDVTDTASLNEAIAGLQPDACVHLAAIAAILAVRRDPDHAWRVNLFGTLAVAEALRRHARDCALLYPSSADAYGKSFRRGTLLDEAAPLAPINIYGATKAAAELALGALATEGLRAIVLRPFNHTGPEQSADFIVPAFAWQVARIEAGLQPPVIRAGALESLRDFLVPRVIDFDGMPPHGGAAKQRRRPSSNPINFSDSRH